MGANGVSKEQIIAEIRRIAEERGGHVSLDAFLRISGIAKNQVLGKHFATWNSALEEAGVQTKKFFNPRYPEEAVLEAVGELVVRLGKWPTEIQLTLERRTNPSFPSLEVVRRLIRSRQLAPAMLRHCEGKPRFESAVPIIRERIESNPDEVVITGRNPVVGHVYMMRSGRHYKIGFTNSPARRHREVRLEMPERTDLVHSIETDDPSGIEAYWHRRFAQKRVRETEFFKLDASDVAAFKRRKYQ